MDSINYRDIAFSGSDLSQALSDTNTFRRRSHHSSPYEAGNPAENLPLHPTYTSACSGYSSGPESQLSYPSHRPLPNDPAMTAHFEVPKLWREAMQCVSINCNLFPRQILQRYYDSFHEQAVSHRSYVELDIWKSKRATDRGVHLVRIHYQDNDPSKISLMVIVVYASNPDTKDNTDVRLVTNTSIHHVLEEPCANCHLWLKVCTDVGRDGTPLNRIIPCCEKWVDSVDFNDPISAEEKRVPAVVARLLEEFKRKDLLLHQKEREMEEKDRLLRHLREEKGQNIGCNVDAAPMADGQYLQQRHNINMEMLEQYWWIAAILMIFLLVWMFK
ncbi:hypothetical protein VM1G_00816 [Cytospora mali]|uniref:Uncharacterized protein n=1 Tax=Cytospora mali TaxID=578113 RepID=A0A194VKV9_CYTMA|nr:hypothetical protein VM1G_00816 [Valsa mali]